MGFFKHLKAMLVRNLLLKKRQKKSTAAEVCLPIYALCIPILMRSALPNTNFPREDGPREDKLIFQHISNIENSMVAIVPNNTETQVFLEAVNQVYKDMNMHSKNNLVVAPINFIYFEDEEDLMAAYWKDPQSIPLAIIFESDPSDNDLRYEIRTNPSSDVTPATSELYAPHSACRRLSKPMGKLTNMMSSSECPIEQYLRSGFIAMQLLIDYTKIKMESNVTSFDLHNISVKMFAKEAFTEDWVKSFRKIIPLYIAMSLSLFITYLLILIVGEKEKKMKEGMKIMGVKDSVYWIAWFLIYGALVLTVSVIATILLYSLDFFEHSNCFLIFLLMLLYGLTIVLFAFILTAFFDKSRTAGFLGSLAINLPGLFYFLPTLLSGSGQVLFLFVSIISSSGFALAMDKALMLDLKGEGVQFYNLWQGPNISFGGSLLMMALDILLYGCLAYYLDNVVPSDHGTRRSPFFCFKLQFWCPKSLILKENVETDEMENGMTSEELNSENIEPVPPIMRGRCAIRITNLHKTFQSCRKQQVNAVNGINLTIYEGQITAILGHNGAGKTTLFNILTGLTSPTEGTAHIFGLDIRNPESMEKIRSMTGVCPQHDILFDLLTPREHLHFFAAIRNVPGSLIDTEVEKTLSEIDLTDKAELATKHLSGGQRRKLSVGIAVIGDPKIVILDEPTSGVDPYSRRHMWSLLQSKKQGKVILLTTHFMDEADILADRKAVISKGRLRCCGSSLFLKNKFGIGYHLTLVLDDNAQEERITDLVVQHLPRAEKARHHGRELSFILPHDAVDKFATLFLDIEQGLNYGNSHLYISSYGVSMTTLEEVFLLLEKDEGDDVISEGNLTKNCIIDAQLPPISMKCPESNVRNTIHNSDPLENESGISADLDVSPEIATRREKSIFESDIKSDVIGLTFEASKIEPNSRRIFMALAELRAVRLLRDSFKFFLMILAPIILSIFGFSALSMQNLDPTVKPLILNASTYGGELLKLPIFDASGAASSLFSDPNIKTEQYDGKFSTLLDIAPHIAALEVLPCCGSKELFKFTALYNDTAQHSLPIIINVLDNALYRYVVGDSSNRTITVKSHPFQMTLKPSGLNIAATSASLLLGTIFLLMPVALSIDIIHDREIKARNQLRVNGLSFFLYFSSYFFVFAGIMLMVFGGVLATILFYNLPSLQELSSFCTLTALILLYIPASILFVSCLSHIFDKADTAHSFMFNILFIIGGMQFFLVTLLDAYEISGKMFLKFHIFFSFMSTTYVPFAIVYFVNRVHMVCQVNIACTYLTVWNYLTYEILIMFVGITVQIPFWYYVLKILDARQCGGRSQSLHPQFFKREEQCDKICKDLSAEYEMDRDIEDHQDVKLEHDKVARCLASPGEDPPVILLQNLRKEYKRKNGDKLFCNSKDEPVITVAVQNLSLTVEASEVLGLLGHNGAGKTTTMKIVTAEESPTNGKVEVKGINTMLNNRNVFKHIGYCSQDDTQWKNVTVREHLELYAIIRGVPQEEIQMLLDSYLDGLQMKSHADKESQNCSGGTRRKLSFALAMIGNPSIILLDEPSTGMDPKSKRFLWDTILASFKGKRGAILTTHSMEEADALCSRVGIMVNGRLRCIGSTQHLKNLYGAGYSLEIKLKFEDRSTSSSLPGRQELLKSFVFNLFPQAVLEECFEERLMFGVPQRAVTSLADCFSKLEEAKRDLDIEEYSFSQTTLEQVFLRFSHCDEIKNL